MKLLEYCFHLAFVIFAWPSSSVPKNTCCIELHVLNHLIPLATISFKIKHFSAWILSKKILKTKLPVFSRIWSTTKRQKQEQGKQALFLQLIGDLTPLGVLNHGSHMLPPLVLAMTMLANDHPVPRVKSWAHAETLVGWNIIFQWDMFIKYTKHLDTTYHVQ